MRQVRQPARCVLLWRTRNGGEGKINDGFGLVVLPWLEGRFWEGQTQIGGDKKGLID